MATRSAIVADLGEVIISKRRGVKHLKLSITHDGRVRVSLPQWMPYSAGVTFAKKHRIWAIDKLSERPVMQFSDSMLIGKSHRLKHFTENKYREEVYVRRKNTTIEVYSALELNDPAVADKLIRACEQALRRDAAVLLPQRLKHLAGQHDFAYESVKIKKLTSRWGSCSDKKTICLSYFLIQLPWYLIDYVLIHELVHTRHMNHSPQFWQTLEKVLPNAKQLRRDIRTYRPYLISAEA